MINKIYKIALVLIGMSSVMLLNSCSDWTEVEPVDIVQYDITELNPELYAQYLENLRAYKKSDHKNMIVSFNNAEKEPFTLAQHINVVPDSVDYISLQYPDNLSEWELAEMDEVREKKGTKFIFSIGFDALKLHYDIMETERQAIIDELEEGAELPAELPGFRAFLVDTINSSLALVRKYNYDGVCFAYRGKGILHMTSAEKLEYKGYHNSFIGILKDWSERNKDKKLFFEGYPQNLLDRSFLSLCENIIIPCSNAGSVSKVSYSIHSSITENVPVDRFVVSVEMTSLDPADVKTGYWADGETRSVAGVSVWAAVEHTAFTIKGMAINNVSNDYFDKIRLYHQTRTAINTINPSITK